MGITIFSNKDSCRWHKPSENWIKKLPLAPSIGLLTIMIMTYLKLFFCLAGLRKLKMNLFLLNNFRRAYSHSNKEAILFSMNYFPAEMRKLFSTYSFTKTLLIRPYRPPGG